MATAFDRRGFLRRGTGLTAGATLLTVGGGGLLAACGDDDDEAASGGGSLGVLDIRFSWIKTVEFAGEFVADQRGYYKAAGFSGVNLIAGGPSATPQDTDVATGKAFLGISAPDVTGSAVVQGAPLKIIGAQFQKNPFAITSMAATPIMTPQEMVGKKIGVAATNESVWSAFLKANKLDPASIDRVPVEFDPLPLTTGTVDGWFSFITDEPNRLRVKGFDTFSFLLADHNYPLVSETFMVTDESITKKRDKIKAALTAEIRGWKDATADAALGARLATTVYGKDLGLDEKEQVLESQDQNALILTGETRANGLFTMTDKLVEENVATLRLAGVNLPAEKLFDLSILKELYEEKPELR